MAVPHLFQCGGSKTARPEPAKIGESYVAGGVALNISYERRTAISRTSICSTTRHALQESGGLIDSNFMPRVYRLDVIREKPVVCGGAGCVERRTDRTAMGQR
jgi:hypothetical protein